MADLLRSGNTMLNMACPICNNPIFRNKDGAIFCPTCNRNVLIVNDSSQQNLSINKDEIHREEHKNLHEHDRTRLLIDVQNTLFAKIEIITKKLKEETQVHLMEAYTKILLNCFEILDKISFRK